MSNEEAGMSSAAEVDRLASQIQGLTENHQRMVVEMQNMVKINSILLGSLNLQESVIESVQKSFQEVTSNITRRWTEFAVSKSENQRKFEAGLEERINLQNREIQALKNFLEEREEYHANNKNECISRIYEQIYNYKDDRSPKYIEEQVQEQFDSEEESLSEMPEKESINVMPKEEESLSKMPESKEEEGSEEGSEEETDSIESNSELAQSSSQQSSNCDQQSRTITVSNLPKDAARSHLTSHFGAAGPIDNIVIRKLFDSAVALITFRSIGSAIRAVNVLSKERIGGRRITVSFSEITDNENSGSKSEDSTASKQSYNSGRFYWEEPRDSSSSVDFQLVHNQPKIKGFSSHTTVLLDPIKERTIYVRELDPDITEKTLYKTFSKFGTVEKVDIKRRTGHTGTYAFAFLQFANAQMTKRAKSAGSVLIGHLYCVIGDAKK